MKPGDKAKLSKQTFLHKGIFIFTGSTVEIKEIQENKAIVIYNDKEGYPHDLEMNLTDLTPVS
ncbi:MAG: hypothetical protein ACO1NV_00485 [Leptospira bouyouniensis]|uniref:Uncharacterized protein n=1 Tax=Leptospira bouyouniensis TaxID=2484911 RepID=A0A7I0IJ12_9LEPT|nr:hypothetical protein [Leptospira bouyouniensis]TGK46933.1 hypothetical protein EHQ10_16445 [Leptospira bouyouniensis]TGL03108.1 hypothetical protein EHQ43_14995 [Leptospira bouyouniensis]TGM80038.1 hypothetical protein EHQ99_09980 [Leptospira bouyouniensis]